ncbi:MAG: hypothetical protein K6G90_02855 [Clostridia bacterium]|nr:hypothetical protein [Clostridia bacterium]
MSTCFIAHKGYSSVYEGNTEEAFLGAVAHGSGGIETDIRATKDGVLVCNHNDEVAFKDGSELICAEHTFEELRRKPIRNTKTDTDLYLCPFSRYLEICAEGDMICFIEFKGPFTDKMITDSMELVRKIYDIRKVALQSFSLENLIRAHELYPELNIMLTGTGYNETAAKALELGFDMDNDYTRTELRQVREFHDAGRKYGIWTCNDKQSVEFGRVIGADYIESDVYASFDELPED